MNESKASLSRANMYAHLGAQYCFNIASEASSGNYIVGELHTERTMLTREQIAARCRKQRLEAGLPVYDAPKIRSREAQPSQRHFCCGKLLRWHPGCGTLQKRYCMR
ncbi:hypothetical protein KTQ42_16255|uniref:hypothetical protein n=1 Tax=Noviherbaspirillum sp. L7-7A TaxID=2850560 RepID=UPI001C2C2A64|nr:hypothetical protein [Noviherbaspirillum sp. L7-7A]MBV0880851.1 hypothetical protein [Noviherbaspirillum sp. L7-7A]